MDFHGILVLAAIWLLGSLFSWGRRKYPPAPRAPKQEPAGPAQPAPKDATQREGRRLELVLRQFERALEAGQTGRPARAPLPRAAKAEDRESLEMEPEVGSLETEVRREGRREVDQDDEAEQIAARRITAAAVRDEPRSKKDQVVPDKRIRQEPADKTAVARYTTQQLRHAVVWREILGPPVSLSRSEPDSWP